MGFRAPNELHATDWIPHENEIRIPEITNDFQELPIKSALAEPSSVCMRIRNRITKYSGHDQISSNNTSAVHKTKKRKRANASRARNQINPIRLQSPPGGTHERAASPSGPN